jgi:FtsZ-binding cell division protein ZapB
VNKDVQANIALGISLLVGLSMFFAKMVEVWGQRKAKTELDLTTVAGKEIDDEAAWRKDILSENANLRSELRQANTIIHENQTKCAERIGEVLGKMMDITNRIQQVAEGAEK